jgi:hypothetical protein
MRGASNGVLYEQLGQEDHPGWVDADEVFITIPPNANAPIPDLLKHLISMQDTMDIFVPSQPMTCRVEEKEHKKVFKCDL